MPEASPAQSRRLLKRSSAGKDDDDGDEDASACVSPTVFRRFGLVGIISVEPAGILPRSRVETVFVRFVSGSYSVTRS